VGLAGPGGAAAAQHLIRAEQLRDRFRRDECADLKGVQAGRDQRLDESDPVGGADRRFLVLQAVARADLDDANGLAHGQAAGSTSASSTPSPTMSPTLHWL